MHNAQATIYCSNPLCQSPNPEGHKFCQKCRTLLPKRYLWAVGSGVEAYRPGELLAGRYLIKRSQVVLDTQPGLQPDPIAEIPQFIEPYLRLTPFQLHVPQVYGLIRHRVERSSSEILLLEQAPIYPDGVGVEVNTTNLPLDQPPVITGQLMPELGNVWKQSSALRQLNWLWQIAQLWQPLSTEGVATTLLTPALIRVEGSLIRLLELHFDHNATPNLANLAQVWLPLSSTARPEINGFLQQICQWMQQGRLRSSEELLTLLDRGLAVCGQAQTRQVQVATLTDQGPSRQRNEDACSPASGTVATATLSAAPTKGGAAQLPMVIVCDGIGGHEGGNVASNLAINTIQQQFSQLPTDPMFLTPVSLKLQLESAIYVANDRISQRNDQEQRQERQRMGTTLVMALAHAHEMYITHVGDSRVYRVTRTGCHQVTLDDDVASREVRLGYALYRDALQQAASGSLVQALGMSTSELLHPTVQRLVIDEDCVFLLCSDGLSDNDRVEQNWDTELLPILAGQQDVATASKRLVELANTKNGHDNVTVGLIYCRVAESGVIPAQALMAQLADLPTTPPANLIPTGAVPSGNPRSVAAPAAPTIAKTKVLPPRRKPLNPVRFFLSSILFLGIAGLLAYILAPNFPALFGSFQSEQPPVSSTDPDITNSPSPTPSLTLPKGALVQLSASFATPAPANPVLLSQPADGQNQPTNTPQAAGTVPLGSVVQILGKLEGAERNNWLNLKVCSTPASTPNQPLQNSSSPTNSPSVTLSPTDRPFTSISPAPTNQTPRSLRPGETGWLLEQEFVPLVSQQIPANAGVCQPVQSSPLPSSNQSTQ
jgi:protein phosphatase